MTTHSPQPQSTSVEKPQPTNTRNSVLLVYGEEHSNSNRRIADELTLDGYDVRRAGGPESLKACWARGDVDLLIFGYGHNATMLGVLRDLRAGRLSPDVETTARVLWIDKGEGETEALRAFDAGSDDVIRSPLHRRELLARISAVLRRGTSETPAVIRYRQLEIDTAAHRVTFDSTPVALRRLEYRLLIALAQSPSRVFTKAELLHNVWGFRSTGATRTVDSHASRLRRKLAEAGAPGWIANVWGVGYTLHLSHGALHDGP